MTTVTGFIKNIQQPRGGYLSSKLFKKITINDNQTLFDNENIPPVIIGTFIDSFSRFLLGENVEIAFKYSIKGAELIGELKIAKRLIKNITGLNERSILSACKLVGYDTVYRAGPSTFVGIDYLIPNYETIFNLNLMIERSLIFFEKYGPVVESGITFEGGYTDIITNGDADFLTHDTLWDMKVIKSEPTTQHTFQLIIYYLLMSRSENDNFKFVKKLGIFNPRKNIVYLYFLDDMNKCILDEILTLICFGPEALKQDEQKRFNEIIDKIEELSNTNIDFKKLKSNDCIISFLKHYFDDFDMLYNKPYGDYKIGIDSTIENAIQITKNRYSELCSIGINEKLATMFIINNIHSVEDITKSDLQKLASLIQITNPNSSSEAFADYLLEKALNIYRINKNLL